MNAAVRPALVHAVGSLWQREIVRFYRQRSRIVGALGTPMVFWLLIGSGFGRSVRTSVEPSDHFLVYAFPGTLLLILLFTAIFSTISIIEDRQAGFLQGVLVAPVGRTAVVLGKLLGSTSLGVLQGTVFLLLAPLSGIPITPTSFALGFGLSAVGFLIAWTLESTQGFHAIMNLVLMPLWMMSGALFPPDGASPWMQWIIAANPLTYGVVALRCALGGLDRSGGTGLATALAICILFSVVMTAASLKVAARPTRE
jgi:ABC-2 type transport system permease protein